LLSLRDYVEKHGYKDYGLVDRYYEPTKILTVSEKNKEISKFLIKGTIIESVGSVLTDRRHIHEILEVDNDVDAYKKVLRSLGGSEIKSEGMPQKLKELKPNLLELPAVKFYEKDGGLYFTSSIVVACQDHVCNASVHRLMVIEKDKAVIRLVPRHLWRMYRESISKGTSLKVSIVFGVHPIFLLAAATSPSYGVFELTLPSLMLGKEVKLVESPINRNPIPWPFSVLLEAEITKESALEGPFVDVTKTYDEVRRQPVVKVKKVLVNKDEPFHIILPGGREHMLLMGFPREAIIWDAVSKVVPKVHAVRLTPGGGGWLHAIISIEKNHDGDAKNAILAAFAAHPSLKHVVVVDPDINIDDPEDVEWAIATRFQGDRDLIIIREARGSTLDPSSKNAFTTKIGIDATAPLDNKDRYAKVRLH
jgi:UbiD family decarboxylase